MKKCIGVIGTLFLITCTGCVSGNIRDDFVAGWQSQRDLYIHQYVHQSFTQQRRWTIQRAALVRSDTLVWPDYARPALAAATRARALSQDRGRALVLERFLEHMRTTPTADATAAWFAREAADIRDAAQESAGRSQALLADLAGAEAVTEALFERIESTASMQGVVRGRALQHADLRRTARLYFQARDDEVDIPGNGGDDLSAGTDGVGARPDALIRDVNRALEASDLRAAILQPRRCALTDGIVICAPDRSGTASQTPLGEDDAEVPQPANRLTGPGNNANDFPGAPRRDFYEGRPGW